jgi:hypothetical protein
VGLVTAGAAGSALPSFTQPPFKVARHPERTMPAIISTWSPERGVHPNRYAFRRISR